MILTTALLPHGLASFSGKLKHMATLDHSMWFHAPFRADGKIFRNSKIRLIREGVVIYTGELATLKRFKDDVKEVAKGYDCGMQIKNYNDIHEYDVIEAFQEVEVKKKLK